MCCCAGWRAAAADEARASLGPSCPVAGARPGGGVRPCHGAVAASAAADPAGGCDGKPAMSVGFRAVQWNRTKLVYDGILLAAVALYIGGFVAVDASLAP